MDSTLALALLFSGTFLGVCLTGIFYVTNIRPRLLGEVADEDNSDPWSMARSHIGGGGNNSAAQLELLQDLSERLALIEARLDQADPVPLAPLSGPDAKPSLEALLAIQEDFATLAKQLGEHLEAQDQALQSIQAQLDLNTSVVAHANAILDDMDADIDLLKTQGPRVIRTRPVRLTDIKGVGPVFAAHLYEAGIENYQQLAALTPDELRNLIQVPEWRKIDAEDWIEQARLLAAQQEKLEAYS